MKETQAAIIETSKYPVRFFHHDFSHILKIILSTDFVEKKVIVLTFAQLLLGINTVNSLDRFNKIQHHANSK